MVNVPLSTGIILNDTPPTVIVVSARGDVDAKVKGLEAGADDYLAKPFSIIELVARVQALLRRTSRNEEPTTLAVDDLEMDLVTHRVTRGGARIDLQPLEYQLLEYLMRNKGRVVSRNTILDRVWNYSFDPHTNVVESRVYHLREKIDRQSARKLLRTVRGFGYVLG
jgi:DNA-binding response OmpR family regulator